MATRQRRRLAAGKAANRARAGGLGVETVGRWRLAAEAAQGQPDGDQSNKTSSKAETKFDAQIDSRVMGFLYLEAEVEGRRKLGQAASAYLTQIRGPQ